MVFDKERNLTPRGMPKLYVVNASSDDEKINSIISRFFSEHNGIVRLDALVKTLEEHCKFNPLRVYSENDTVLKNHRAAGHQIYELHNDFVYEKNVPK